jgi:hypothetical protein
VYIYICIYIYLHTNSKLYITLQESSVAFSGTFERLL